MRFLEGPVRKSCPKATDYLHDVRANGRVIQANFSVARLTKTLAERRNNGKHHRERGELSPSSRDALKSPTGPSEPSIDKARDGIARGESKGSVSLLAEEQAADGRMAWPGASRSVSYADRAITRPPLTRGRIWGKRLREGAHLLRHPIKDDDQQRRENCATKMSPGTPPPPAAERRKRQI